MSRSGYYRHVKVNDPGRIQPDFYLISKVREIHVLAKKKYGFRRMSEQLRAEGYEVGRYRARNLMMKAGVSVTCKKKFKRTADTISRSPRIYWIADSMLKSPIPFGVPTSHTFGRMRDGCI